MNNLVISKFVDTIVKYVKNKYALNAKTDII